jgi:hypothetical protein
MDEKCTTGSFQAEQLPILKQNAILDGLGKKSIKKSLILFVICFFNHY